MTTHDNSKLVSRRKLLLGSAATAATVSLGSALALPPAHAAGSVQWSVVANGYNGSLVFDQRLGLGGTGIGSGGWQLGGGVMGSAYGDAMLAFAVGSNGLHFARLIDPELNRFQIYRSDKIRSDSYGPGGLFWQYDWNATSRTYEVTQASWKATASGSPWTLPVDTGYQENDKGRSWWKFDAGSYRSDSGIRDMAYGGTATGHRSVWGQFVGPTNTIESFVGLTSPSRHSASPSETSGPWSMEDTMYVRHAKHYADPFSFIRPLDTGFNRFQVWRGRDRRSNVFVQELGGSLHHSNLYRGGTVTEINQGAGQQISGSLWNTIFYEA
jgi:hypothetical protein